MSSEVGRNDPCPCGSGKKFKACCWIKKQPGRRKISARLISGGSNLMQRTLGATATSTSSEEGSSEDTLKSRISKGAAEKKSETSSEG